MIHEGKSPNNVFLKTQNDLCNIGTIKIRVLRCKVPSKPLKIIKDLVCLWVGLGCSRDHLLANQYWTNNNIF